jgi:hypothetical protein
MWMLILVFLSGTPANLSVDGLQRIIVQSEDKDEAARLCFIEERAQVADYISRGVIVASRCVPMQKVGRPI